MSVTQTTAKLSARLLRRGLGKRNRRIIFAMYGCARWRGFRDRESFNEEKWRRLVTLLDNIDEHADLAKEASKARAHGERTIYY